MKELLRAVFLEHEIFGWQLGVRGVDDLNRLVADGGFDGFVRAVEAIHARKFSELGDAILARPDVRIVLVAGPSSAGKTTFAKRLANVLRDKGVEPLALSTDNYYLGDALTPKGEDGKPDYEHIDALDVARLREDLAGLLEGRDVFLRRYEFSAKEGRDDPSPTRLGANGRIVVEGLHCLNPALFGRLPPERLFRVYVNAVTQLDAVDGGRISTTDNRLLRRIVRDHLFRGTGALETLRIWPSVRRGETRWIFPYEDNADIAFNSALGYEFAVIKPIVAPLLREIDPASPEGQAAARLLDFLRDFREAPLSDAIPGDSILREYIGGSSLEY